MKTILCATRLELESTDITYLTMNNINLTSKLIEGLQALAEGESNTIIFTESVLDEQMTDREFIDYIHLLNNLYPKKIRMVYLKRRRNSDEIVDILYGYNNWDIYYNFNIAHVDSTDIIKMVEERKMPDTDYKRAFSTEEVIESGVAMKDSLLETLKSTRDFNNNVFFQSTVSRNMHLVRDMALTLDLTLKELASEQRLSNSNRALISKLNQDLNDLQNKLNDTVLMLNNSKDVNSKMMKELTMLQSKHNALVTNLQDLLFLERTNTLNHRHKKVERVSNTLPNIIYIKQISHTNHLTTYLSNLTSIMNDSVGLTKLYVIEAETNLLSIPRYEKRDFSYVTDGTSLTEIILNNLISCGLEPKLLDFLVDNSLNLDYLIILDKTGVNFDLISGKNVLKLMTGRSIEDFKTLDIDSNLAITNDKNSDLFVPVVKDYKKFLNNKQLELSLVSSLDITRNLIGIMAEFNNMNSATVSEVNLKEMPVQEVDLEEEVNI